MRGKASFGSERARRRRWPMMAVAVVAAVSGVACASSSSPSASGGEGPGTTVGRGEAGADVTLPVADKPTSGGSLRYALAAETDGWNPTTNRWAGDGTTVGLAIFDPLAAYAADGSVQPYLAKSFDHNADFTEWKIGLRDGPTFHDGTPVDAAAVVKTIDAFRKSPLTGQSLKTIDSVEPTDPKTVTIKLNAPASTLPVSFTGQGGAIAAPAQLDDPSGSQKPIGSGPFRFIEWQPSSKLVVDKYDKYWRKDAAGNQLPYLDRIIFTPVTDVEQRINGLRSGDIDMTQTVESGAVATLRGLAQEGKIQLVEQHGQTEVGFIMLNMAAPPFDDKNARLAVAHATDRNAYVDTLGNGVTEPTRTLFRPGTPWYSDVPIPDFDLEAAKKDVAAYSAANGGKPLEFTLAVAPATSSMTAAQLLQDQWKAAGMQVELKNAEATTYLLDGVMGQYQAAQWAQFGSPDPDYEQVWWRSSSSKPPGEISLNFPRHTDPATDAALDEARKTQDVAARKAAFDKVQQRLAEDLPYVYIAFAQTVVAAGEQVRGITNGPLPDGVPARGIGGPGSFSNHTFLTQVWLVQR